MRPPPTPVRVKVRLLVATVTGLEIESLCADLTTFVPGRALDDDASMLLRFAGGARGVLVASQVNTGFENGLHLRVAALLDKPSRRLKQVKGDYVGFEIPNEFVVGYGLDYAERYRNLKDVCILTLPPST